MEDQPDFIVFIDGRSACLYRFYILVYTSRDSDFLCFSEQIFLSWSRSECCFCSGWSQPSQINVLITSCPFRFSLEDEASNLDEMPLMMSEEVFENDESDYQTLPRARVGQRHRGLGWFLLGGWKVLCSGYDRLVTPVHHITENSCWSPGLDGSGSLEFY